MDFGADDEFQAGMVGTGERVCAGKNRRNARSGYEPDFEPTIGRAGDGVRMQRMPMSERKLLRGVILATALIFFACFAIAPRARAQSALPAASAVASPKTYVSNAPVPRGTTFEIGVVVGIMPGFHMNAHKVSEDYLIPTNLTAKLPAGIKEVRTLYPEGTNLKLSFSDKPLSVYTKQFTVRAKFSASATAPLGKTNLPFTLQYQACNDSACLPPIRIPVIAEIDIAPAGAKARAMSPNLFSSKQK